LTSFDRNQSTQIELQLPDKLIQKWKLRSGTYRLKNILNDTPCDLVVKNGRGTIHSTLAPLESQVFLLGQGADF
jgi:hypothetical protein